MWVDMLSIIKISLHADLILAWITTLDLARVNGLKFVELCNNGVFCCLTYVLQSYALS